MTNKNTVYTVTPPDLALNTIGPSVLLLGINLENSKEYTDIYDKLFPEVEITFYVSEDGFQTKHAPWFRAANGMASSIFVNLDDITAEEVFLAQQAENEGKAMVFWISIERKFPVMISLLNSYQIRVFSSIKEIEEFLLENYAKGI